MYSDNDDDTNNPQAEREARIREMRMVQDEMMYKSDISKTKKNLSDMEMSFRILQKKESDLRMDREALEHSKKKLEEELRMKEEEYRIFRKKRQEMGK